MYEKLQKLPCKCTSPTIRLTVQVWLSLVQLTSSLNSVSRICSICVFKQKF